MTPVFAEQSLGAPQEDRLGLALSGGGLRAAFFHAGVLARLADLNLLQRIEIISTVSGGSIVGALYVLHLARAAKAGSVDYHEIVADTVTDLERVAEVDLRASTFRNPLKTLYMGWPFQDSYSRSDRIAELYDRYLYRQFVPPPEGSGLRHRFRLVFEEYVGPWRYRKRALLSDFDVSGDRPRLMINATVLNTGHPWRFESHRFGEPKREPIRRFVDRNTRLPRPKRMDHPNLPEKYREFDVASAVTASACFPGFQPMAMTDLYERWRPELADGGIYDNQGLEALVHRECTQFIVSDGSGQMEDKEKPDTKLPAVISRSFSIASGSIREDHLYELLRAHPSSAVPHLRAGAATEGVQWMPDPPPEGDAEEGVVPFPDAPAEWQVDPEVQTQLARIRTDLDTFSEIERHALMLDGYRLATAQLERPGGIAEGASVPDDAEGRWAFASIGPFMSSGHPELLRQLRVSKERFFKYGRILGRFGALLYLLLLAGIVYGVIAGATWDELWFWNLVLSNHPPIWAWALGAGGVVLVWFVPPLLRLVVWGLLPTIGVFVPWWHLLVNRRIYLSRGKLSRLG